MPDDVGEELLRIAKSMPSGDVATDPFQPRPAVSARTRSLVAELHRRLSDESGFVILTGLPVPEDLELVKATYWLLGLLVGEPTRETARDESLIRHIENIGRDPSVAGGQGYRVSTAQGFHVDRGTDLLGLLCVSPAHSGGVSRLMSGKKLHNILLDEHPDHLSTLYQPFPYATAELRVPTGEVVRRWCEIPLFGWVDGRFFAHYDRSFIDQAQAIDDAPRLTPSQVAALDAADEVVNRSELTLELNMRPGDLQLLNNLYVMHSRTAYNDTPEQRRLLLRIYLAFAGSPGLPPEYAPMFGATAAGTYRGGMWRVGKIGERLGTPISVA